MISREQIRELIARDDVLGLGDSIAVSRLLPHVKEVSFAPGQAIYRARDKVENLYYLVQGEVEVSSGMGACGKVVTRGCFGEEGGAGLAEYVATARALAPSVCLAIPKTDLDVLYTRTPGFSVGLISSLLAKFNQTKSDSKLIASHGEGSRDGEWPKIVGWALACILPVLTFMASTHYGLGTNAAIYLAIMAVTVQMWAFSLVDEYLTCVFALLATLVMGLVPAKVVLSGFASDGFFLAMSILGLGTVIVSSGLSYRCLLLLLSRLPSTQFWMNFGVILTGVALTPLLPTANGRVALMKPFSDDVVKTLGFGRGKAATKLSLSSFNGVVLFSGIFLTSKSINIVVYGLLPQQGQDHFQWLTWFLAAAFSGFVLFLVYAAIVAVFFRNNEKTELPKDLVSSQLKALGKLKRSEWAALLGILVFMAGVVSTSLHRIQPPWLALGVLYWLLLFGFLPKEAFRSKIDWPFLIYLAGIVGIVNTFNAVGLNTLMADKLAFLGKYMQNDFGLFILMLFGIITVLRIALPINAAVVICATALMPIAEGTGVNPWVVGFIILTLGEMWFLPYQCSYYLQFRESGNLTETYDEKSFLWSNALINVAKVATIYATIPYWKMLGLI